MTRTRRDGAVWGTRRTSATDAGSLLTTLSPEGCDGRRPHATAPVATTSRVGRGTRGAAVTLRSTAAPTYPQFPGTTVKDTTDPTRPWNGYVAISTNALDANPLF